MAITIIKLSVTKRIHRYMTSAICTKTATKRIPPLRKKLILERRRIRQSQRLRSSGITTLVYHQKLLPSMVSLQDLLPIRRLLPQCHGRLEVMLVVLWILRGRIIILLRLLTASLASLAKKWTRRDDAYHQQVGLIQVRLAKEQLDHKPICWSNCMDAVDKHHRHNRRLGKPLTANRWTNGRQFRRCQIHPLRRDQTQARSIQVCMLDLRVLLLAR